MVVALSDFKLAVNWLGKLGQKWGKLKEHEANEIARLGDELFVHPRELAEVYVQPFCQHFNPADQGRDHGDPISVPLFKFLEVFFQGNMTQSDGRRHHFILSDAGMGKTSLMAMLKMGFIRGFWPKDHLCEALKLGKESLSSIERLKEKGRTILLLDGLDEDPEAMGRIEARLDELLKATRRFRRVVITCRTQFFPKGQGDVFNREDRIKLGPFTCPVVYLSLFSDDQVLEYLHKKFKPSWFQKVLRKDNDKVTDAQAIVNAMDTLRFRPMLLAYIEDFMLAGYKGDNIYEIYRVLVNKWLERETTKDNVKLDEGDLLEASKILAREMTLAGVRAIYPERTREDNSVPSLESLAQKHEVIGKLDTLTLKGRTLLNKNADGAYRFAHYSIQEFLVVSQLSDRELGGAYKLTDLMLRFIREGGFKDLNLAGADPSGQGLDGLDLSNLDLNGMDLRGMDFKACQLSNSRFCGANLEKAEFLGDSILEADLTCAIITGMRLVFMLPGDVPLTMVCIPAGTFLMGSLEGERGRKADETLHKVTISTPFFLGETTVTQAQWKAIMGNNPSKSKGDDLPVDQVSWNDAMECILTLNGMFQSKFCLPTEAQWEYACRAGTHTPFSFGSHFELEETNIDGKRNHGEKTGGISPNKSISGNDLPPNKWGLFQMHGNVWEWCSDWYGEYPSKAVTDPQGPETGQHRVLRGGSWLLGGKIVRSAVRERCSPEVRISNCGFRFASGQAPF